MSPLTVKEWQAMSRAGEPGTSRGALIPTRKMTTAEWQCTKCGVTNRKLVLASATDASDRCMHCGARHTIRPNQRPVRWNAEPAR